jgi:hypothetical protein
MRPFLAICLVLAIFILPVPSHGQTKDPSAPLTVPQYIQELDQSIAIVQQLDKQPQKASDLLHTLPSAWQVQVEGGNFEIPAESIRRDLAAWQAKPTRPALDLIRQHLETLRYQAAGYETNTRNIAAQQSLLNNILSRSEFRNVHGQSWIDRFKQKIQDLLLRLLGKVVTSSAIPMISDLLVYGLTVIAVVMIAYWLYRSLRESTRLETIMPVHLPVSAKEWPLWLAEARSAAARGEWRDAIHLAYWGGISFLEVQGAWRPDRARTPREYLRLLPPASAHQPVLRALTVRLESVWYGMEVAGAESFEQTLAELELLGYPCN